MLIAYSVFQDWWLPGRLIVPPPDHSERLNPCQRKPELAACGVSSDIRN